MGAQPAEKDREKERFELDYTFVKNSVKKYNIIGKCKENERKKDMTIQRDSRNTKAFQIISLSTGFLLLQKLSEEKKKKTETAKFKMTNGQQTVDSHA